MSWNLIMPAMQKAILSPAKASEEKTSSRKAATQQTLARTKVNIANSPTKPSARSARVIPALVGKTTTRKIPVKQSSPKKIPVNQTQPVLPKDSPAKQICTTSPTNQQLDKKDRIWTAATAQSFYSSVNSISRNSNGIFLNRSVQPPENYRLQKCRGDRNSANYTLSYEEELHLADHFAFLAHAKEGAEFVSAVTIEESRKPPAFTVRLASNETPTPHVTESLERILQVVREHALEGRYREKYRARLFDEVVRLSQQRIYARLRSSQREPQAIPCQPSPPSLSSQIKKRLLNLGDSSYKSSIADLMQSLKRLDKGPLEDEMGLLKDVIQKCHTVSHQGSSKSLEDALQKMEPDRTICQSRVVLTIDKLSKYLDLCDDLIRLSRQPSTLELCRGLRLEVLPSYPVSKPLGSPTKCHVHGEVQLVLFHERYSSQLPPRAIGSSKSACYLCDLFIKKDGRFGISHAHMKAYPMWTIPEVSWMSTRQVEFFRGVIHAMTLDIEALLETNIYHYNAAIESRAHILQIVQSSEIASSLVTPALSEAQLGHNRTTLIPAVGLIPSAATLTSTRMISSLYYFQDLPITLEIVPSTISCTFLVGKLDYIFDLEEVDCGELVVSDYQREEETTVDNLRINVRDLSSAVEYIKSEEAARSLTFHVHDAGTHELRVSMTWNPRPA